MRTHGTLTKWNDDRGFGFISPAQGDGDIFVHISSFPKDGKRPQLNELISYEAETGSDGKLRAVRVMRPGGNTASHPPRSQNRRQAKSRASGYILILLAVAATGIYGYSRLRNPVDSAGAAELIVSKSSTPSAPTFRCDGRTVCSQMSSCAEAMYFLRHCPGAKMDGDNDGRPCEQQWCN
jgi:cold shock CspA family protein